MIGGVLRLKICGITSLRAAEAAVACGADYLGFNFYPTSPRYVSPERFAAMAGELPNIRRVAVSVEPTDEELKAQAEQGLDFFQIHFRPDQTAARIRSWNGIVGRNRLWLVPKLPPGTKLPAALLAQADTFMLDGHKTDQFGGTGRTSDWNEFRSLREAHGDKTWILAGGLSPENIGRALAETGARFVDVNSGVESAPGIKEPAKLQAFVAAIRQALQAS